MPHSPGVFCKYLKSSFHRVMDHTTKYNYNLCNKAKRCTKKRPNDDGTVYARLKVKALNDNRLKEHHYREI